MQKRARKDFGQRYWWHPGGSPIPGLNRRGEDFWPERAPDVERAVEDR
jgi:hypothetical protein